MSNKKTSQDEKVIVKHFSDSLKSNYIKNMVQGFEIAMNMISAYCDNHTLEEVKEFCEKGAKKKSLELIENVVNKKKEK